MREINKMVLVILTGIMMIFSSCNDSDKALQEEAATALKGQEETVQVDQEKALPEDTSSKDKPKTIREQIKNGDFSSVKESDDFIERMRFVYQVHLEELEEENQEIQWVDDDITGDGVKELIWQTNSGHGEKMKSILGVFTIRADEADCIFWDDADLTEFFFLSENGNMIYFADSYASGSVNGFSFYTFDNQGNRKKLYELCIFEIYYFSDMNMQWLHEEHPDIVKEGIYYKKYTQEDGFKQFESMSEKQFLEAFEAMTGSYLYDLKPELDPALPRIWQ